MRIAFLDSWLNGSAEGSGTAVGIGGLGQALVAAGHELSRISPNFDSKTTSLTTRRVLFNATLPFRLRPKRFDLIVGFDIDGFLCPHLSRFSRYCVSIKGVAAEEATHEVGAPHRMLSFLASLEKRNVRQAKLVLTTSRYCSRAIQKHYGISDARIRIVPEGIDLPRWKRMLSAHPRESDEKTILCVARQYPRKHIADLLNAMPLVAKAVPGARAVIVGGGPEHESLRALAKALRLDDNVRFTGTLPDDNDVAALYRRADVFCLPSVQEGFGIVFLEAMASGLPIVSTTAAAIGEVVQDKKGGTLISPGNVDELASALIDLLTDPRRRKEYGTFNETFVEAYDWPRVAQMFLKTIQAST